MKTKLIISAALVALLGLTACKKAPGIKLLNVSYDPTREFYSDVNKAFTAKWKKEHNQDVTI